MINFISHKEILPAWLYLKHNIEPPRHKLLEFAIKGLDFDTKNIKVSKVINGIDVNGTIEAEDDENIYIVKMPKRNAIYGNAYTPHISYNSEHPYVIQINILKWIYGKEKNMKLMALFCDGGSDTVTLPQVEVKHLVDAFTSRLSLLYNTGAVPPMCEDRWVKKDRYGRNTPTKCNSYCIVKDVCPYYKRCEVNW